MRSLFRIKILLVICFIFFFSTQIFSQEKGSSSNTGRGVIDGKDGAAFRLSPQSELKLTIPDWLLPRIKKDPNKYRLKISMSKIDRKFLESKLVGDKETKLTFSLAVNHGTKELKKTISIKFSRANVEEKAGEKYAEFFFPLTNGDEPSVTYTLVGEPVPGAEIYVELEPDDEP